jgi:hypothetical protein
MNVLILIAAIICGLMTDSVFAAFIWGAAAGFSLINVFEEWGGL